MKQKLYPLRCPNCNSTALSVNEVDKSMKCRKCGYISKKGEYKAKFEKIKCDCK